MKDQSIWKDSRSRIAVYVFAFVALCVAGVLTFRASKPPLQLNTITQKLAYQRVYGENTAESDQAWETMFPDQGGFFRHPQLAPERSGFTVFHALHCLDGIRKSYWTFHDAAEAGTPVKLADIPKMHRPSHVRHCIDLIRQILICQPDLTIEPVDKAINGSKGFGVEHKCKDYSQLMGFMAEWEDWEQ